MWKTTYRSTSSLIMILEADWNILPISCPACSRGHGIMELIHHPWDEGTVGNSWVTWNVSASNDLQKPQPSRVGKTIFHYILSTIVVYMVVSWNRGTPKSSTLVGFSLTKTIHFRVPPISGAFACQSPGDTAVFVGSKLFTFHQKSEGHVRGWFNSPTIYVVIQSR